MWYWTLPSLAITGVCIILPNYINALGNYAATGHVNKNSTFLKFKSITN